MKKGRVYPKAKVKRGPRAVGEAEVAAIPAPDPTPAPASAPAAPHASGVSGQGMASAVAEAAAEEITYPDIPGVDIRVTPRGITVFTLDYWADPQKADPAWFPRMKLLYPSEREFRREFLRDWTSAAGQEFYPEWSEMQEELRVFPSPGLAAGPVYRGWDFGIRHPAVIWAQADLRPDRMRLWVLREFMPENIRTGSFCDLVLFLSGQLPEGELDEFSRRWVAKLRADKRMPPPPWFQGTPGRPIRFIDYAGHEATKRSATVESETKESTDASILAAKGVNLAIHFVTVKARENILRSMMSVRSDGYSGLILDPSCYNLNLGLSGGIAYPKPTAAEPSPDQPNKDGFFEHLHDALGYVAVHAIPLAMSAAALRLSAAASAAGKVVLYRSDRSAVSLIDAINSGELDTEDLNLPDTTPDLGFNEAQGHSRGWDQR